VFSKRSYIQLLRMPKVLFDYIMAKVDQDWVAHHDGWTDHTRTERRPGRPHVLDAKSIIALTLCWLGTSCASHHLELEHLWYRALCAGARP
jgi:hypothetical protein